jgi:putative ABC transport system substrate-binding protein
MRRRDVITLVGSAAAVPLLRLPVARAQEPVRIYRLGMMTGASRQAPRMIAFFDEVKLFGFVEGQNLKIVVGGYDLRNDQFVEVAATLAKSAPDVVFCVSDAATRAAKESIGKVPIVALSSDMVAAGLVRTLAHPGGNITGKRLEILMEVVPGPRRFAILADPTNNPPAELQALQDTARAHGVELEVFTVGAADHDPTDQGRCRRARQQNCSDGLGHDGARREIQRSDTNDRSVRDID